MLSFRYSKKKKYLGNSDDRADQIAGRNDDNTLVILRANLELKFYRAVEKEGGAPPLPAPPPPFPGAKNFFST